MLPLSCVVQRRLLAAAIASTVALVPLSAGASSSADVDALWNQPEGVSVDSAFYFVQTWWDGITLATQSDPMQRGLDELAHANTDLLNVYTLLQQQRTDPEPHAVAIVDPFLSGIYNFVTGANVKAPVGALFGWINQSLLKIEGRGSPDDIVRSLLQDYQAKQIAAERDLGQHANAATDALLTANAQRESAFLTKINAVATPGDGLADALADAGRSTTAIAAKHHGDGDGSGQGAGNGGANGKGPGASTNPQGNGQPPK